MAAFADEEVNWRYTMPAGETGQEKSSSKKKGLKQWGENAPTNVTVFIIMSHAQMNSSVRSHQEVNNFKNICVTSEIQESC